MEKASGVAEIMVGRETAEDFRARLEAVRVYLRFAKLVTGSERLQRDFSKLARLIEPMEEYLAGAEGTYGDREWPSASGAIKRIKGSIKAYTELFGEDLYDGIGYSVREYEKIVEELDHYLYPTVGRG